MAYRPQVLTVANGGTGDTTLTSHGVLIGAGTGNVAATAAGSSGQVLQSGGASADPSYSTATFPSTATGTGTILRANGTNWVATTATYPTTTTANRILYSSATSVVGEITSANNAILATDGSGVPSITTASGNWLNTSRCCFSAYSNTAVTNQTGDGTVYTVVFGTELFDQGSNFDGTSTFTAPVTGRYLFTYCILTQNNLATHIPTSELVTTGNTYILGNYGGSFAGNFALTYSVIAPMTAFG